MATDDRDDFVRQLAEMFAAGKDRTALAESVYDALEAPGKLSSHRVLTYRCPRRCRLLEVIVTPQGLLLAFPRYKMSPTVNAERSSESGRAKNTEDGDRRWRRRAFFAESVGNCPLNCDHVREVLELERIDADRAAGLTEVVVHPQR